MQTSRALSKFIFAGAVVSNLWQLTNSYLRELLFDLFEDLWPDNQVAKIKVLRNLELNVEIDGVLKEV